MGSFFFFAPPPSNINTTTGSATINYNTALPPVSLVGVCFAGCLCFLGILERHRVLGDVHVLMQVFLVGVVIFGWDSTTISHMSTVASLVIVVSLYHFATVVYFL